MEPARKLSWNELVAEHAVDSTRREDNNAADPDNILRLALTRKGQPDLPAPGEQVKRDTAAALDLVRHASEVLLESEERTQKLEAHMRELLDHASEQLDLAEARVTAAEAKAEAAEARAQAAEAQAQAAEAQAHEAYECFARLRGAIVDQFASRSEPKAKPRGR